MERARFRHQLLPRQAGCGRGEHCRGAAAQDPAEHRAGRAQCLLAGGRSAAPVRRGRYPAGLDPVGDRALARCRACRCDAARAGAGLSACPARRDDAGEPAPPGDGVRPPRTGGTDERTPGHRGAHRRYRRAAAAGRAGRHARAGAHGAHPPSGTARGRLPGADHPERGAPATGVDVSQPEHLCRCELQLQYVPLQQHLGRCRSQRVDQPHAADRSADDAPCQRGTRADRQYPPHGAVDGGDHPGAGVRGALSPDHARP